MVSVTIGSCAILLKLAIFIYLASLLSSFSNHDDTVDKSPEYYKCLDIGNIGKKVYDQIFIWYSKTPCLQADLLCSALFRRYFPSGVIVHSDKGS